MERKGESGRGGEGKTGLSMTNLCCVVATGKCICCMYDSTCSHKIIANRFEQQLARALK